MMKLQGFSLIISLEKRQKKRSFIAIFMTNMLKKVVQWPNLKNLSGGLNLSRGSNIVGST